ncbi:MAG: GMC family oxidoreductase N-terminal domain-containing protein, partial [Pseudomonadota bacterium]
MGDTYDYVIAGGGSAGSVLAARLSENPASRVCLIEAGGRGDGLLVRMPAGLIALLPGRPPLANWAFQSVPQKGLGGRRSYQPRGKALGGSSAINAMLYVRGHRDDYDRWAETCPGWSWDDVLPYFRRSECHEDGADDCHGGDGPVHVSHQKAPRPISRAFVDAGLACQIRERDDFNTGDTEGIGHFQVTQFHGAKNGERCSAAAGYLHPIMDRPNLRVITGARATRIVFDGKRATGVAFRRGRRGPEEIAHAAGEVLVTAGAFGTPQLLMLSGIGPGDEVTRHGIDLRHDLPGVGQNLQDHVDYILSAKSHDRDMFGIGLRSAAEILPHILRWRRDGASMMATPFAEGAAFLKTDPEEPRPDVQLHFCAALVDDHGRKLHMGKGYSCHVCVLYPRSRGTVGLLSSDVMAAPRIDPNYFDAP